MNYEILYFLMFLHYLADFPLQGSYLAENKGKSDYLLFAHAFIWSGIISIGLLYFNLFNISKACSLLFGHYFIDRWKARLNNSGMKELVIDQVLHFIQIIMVI